MVLIILRSRLRSSLLLVRVIFLDSQYNVSEIAVVKIMLEMEQEGLGEGAVSHREVHSVHSGSVRHGRSGLGLPSPLPAMDPAVS